MMAKNGHLNKMFQDINDGFLIEINYLANTWLNRYYLCTNYSKFMI